MTNEEAINLLCFSDWIQCLKMPKADLERIVEAMSIVGEICINQSAHIDQEAWESCPCCDAAKAKRRLVNHALWVKEPEVNKWTLFGKKLEYCPICGRPLTEEAWAELEKRLRGD